MLAEYALIYMLNVPDLAPDATEAVRKYVREGGGLAFYVGETINAAYYNKEFYAKGRGSCPFRSGSLRRC